jgi:hypothetical protein
MTAAEQVPEVEASAEQNADGGAEDSALGRSTIKFPYLDQNDAVEIAKSVHATSGNSCEREQLAGRLSVSAKGGAFGMRLVTARLFGFISTSGSTVSLTPLGQRVIDPQHEKAARAESFLLVPLYRAVYDEYKGAMLPGNTALESAMEKLGVAPKQKDKARQVFQRSATQAGYFTYGTNRLVAPAMKASDVKAGDGEADRGTDGHAPPPPPPPPPSGPQGPVLPPYVQVLVSKLPEPEKPWNMQGRKKWLDAALKIFDLMYEREEGDSSEITIAVTTNSAN